MLPCQEGRTTTPVVVDLNKGWSTLKNRVCLTCQTHTRTAYAISHDECVNKASVEVVPCQKMGRCGFRSGDVLLVKSGNFIFTPVPVVEEAGVVAPRVKPRVPLLSYIKEGALEFEERGVVD